MKKSFSRMALMLVALFVCTSFSAQIISNMVCSLYDMEKVS